MSIKRFHIDVDMEERWIPHFCSMLKKMEYNGNIGHSQIERFYSDGDGDFRPKFNFDVDFEQQKPKIKEILLPRFTAVIDEEVYDAGKTKIKIVNSIDEYDGIYPFIRQNEEVK